MKINIPLVLVTGMLLLSGCHRHRSQAPQLGEVERLVRLETIEPETNKMLVVRRTYTATVEAYEKVDLCARVQAGTTGQRAMRGLVKPIPKEIDIGLQVAAGQTLLELELPDLSADRVTKAALLALADSSLRQAEQAIEVAAADIKETEAQIQRYLADVEFKSLKQKRVTELVKRDTLSEQLKEEADLELKSARAALETARAQVVTKKARYDAALKAKAVAASKVEVAKSELNSVDILFGFTKITAPFPAVITRRWVNTGDTIRDAAMPLLTLQRNDKVRVLLDIPERDVGHFFQDSPSKPGNAVTLVIPSIQEIKPNHEYKGTVTIMAKALDPVTRTMRTEVHLQNDGYLKPQLTGTATVLLAKRKTMTIPSTALVRVGNRVEVFYVANPTGNPPRGVVKSKVVKLGLDDGLRVEILGDSLTGKEKIIRKGNGVVRTGEQAVAIEPREER
jgi:RND family efflux transporter MFP subunit